MKPKKAKLKEPKKQWSTVHEGAVEVISVGHFPTTRMVKLSDGKVVETDKEYLTNLKVQVNG
jgi:hypothetical protein